MAAPIDYASQLLRNGRLVAIPTETVYGLGADAKNPSAVQKVYKVKGRPTTNPLIIHLPSASSMVDWAIDIPSDAWKLAEQFWPGPLTLILKRHPSVPKIVTAYQETVALRVPKHPVTLKLLAHFGGGIAAPSANRYGRISPTSTEHVKEAFGNEIDYILEGGICKIGIESTIVSLLEQNPIVLRHGNISAQTLSKALGKPVLDPPGKQTLRTPGTAASHYAPLQPLYLLSQKILLEMSLALAQERKSFSVLSFLEKPIELSQFCGHWVRAPLDPYSYGHQLYNHLHYFDKAQTHFILVEMPPNQVEWLAIQDRLQRAACLTKVEE